MFSDYSQTYGQQGQPPDFPFPRLEGHAARAVDAQCPQVKRWPLRWQNPGQYITGNQLYSGMPYGMSQPMGMMNFMQPMMYQPPQLSQQYMPNRGLMSGYSTGFGPYGGYQRPIWWRQRRQDATTHAIDGRWQGRFRKAATKMRRNYRKEYDNYHSKPKQKKNRAKRKAGTAFDGERKVRSPKVTART